MEKIVKKRRERFTFALKRNIVEEFKKQSYEISKSMSSRIEEFMENELKKE